MKQHFRPNTLGDTMLSMEEEAILLADATECGTVADNAIATADRIIDVQRGMDDVGLILATIPDTTPVEDQLAQSVAEMAVAGTETDPVALLPDVSEPLQTAEVATEDNSLIHVSGQTQASSANDQHVESGMVQKTLDQIAKIWEAIKQALHAAWKAIKEQIMHIFGVIENINRVVKHLIDEYNQIGSRQPSDKRDLTVFNMGDAFRVNGKMMLGEDRINAIKKLNIFMTSLYGIAPKKVLNIGKHIEQTFRSFDSEHPEQSVKKFADELSPLFEEYTKTFTSSGNYLSDSHDNDGTTTIASGGLLGNFQVTVNIPAALANKDVEDPVEVLVLASKIRTSVVKPVESRTDNHAGLVFPIQNSDYYASCLVGVSSLLHIVLDYKSGNMATQLAAQAAAIERATSDALNKAKRSGNIEALSTLKKIVAINNAYSNWANQPMLKCINEIARVLRAEVQMCRLALPRFK